MTRAALLVPALAILAGCAGLTPEQRDLEAAYQVVHLVDGMQTVEVAASHHQYNDGVREIGMAGAVLGHHPTELDAFAWYAADAAFHLGVTYALRDSPRCERVWQSVSLGVSLYQVGRNFGAGLSVGYPLDAPRAR